MQSRKRALDKAEDECTEEHQPKRRAVDVVPAQLARLALDEELFISVLPRDILTLIAPLLLRHRGHVPDPRALQFSQCIASTQLYGTVEAICFDRNGNLVVPHASMNEVHVFDRAGRLLRTVGTPDDHRNPRACVEDSRGRLFVSETSLRGAHVNVYGADGRLERTIGAGRLRSAAGVDLSRDETVLYVCAADSDSVEAYQVSNGALLHAAAVRAAEGVVVLSDGRVVVSERSRGGHIHVFTAALVSIRRFQVAGVPQPWQLAADRDDNVYIATNTQNSVVVLSSALDWQVLCELRGVRPPGIREPRGIAIDSAGSVAVSEYRGVRLHLSDSPLQQCVGGERPPQSSK